MSQRTNDTGVSGFTKMGNEGYRERKTCNTGRVSN